MGGPKNCGGALDLWALLARLNHSWERGGRVARSSMVMKRDERGGWSIPLGRRYQGQYFPAARALERVSDAYFGEHFQDMEVS